MRINGSTMNNWTNWGKKNWDTIYYTIQFFRELLIRLNTVIIIEFLFYALVSLSLLITLFGIIVELLTFWSYPDLLYSKSNHTEYCSKDPFFSGIVVISDGRPLLYVLRRSKNNGSFMM